MRHLFIGLLVFQISCFAFSDAEFRVFYNVSDGKINDVGYLKRESIIGEEYIVLENPINIENRKYYIVVNGKLQSKSKEEIDDIKKEKYFNDNFTYFESLEKKAEILDSIISGTTIQKIIDRANSKKAETTVRIKETKEKMTADTFIEIK